MPSSREATPTVFGGETTRDYLKLKDEWAKQKFLKERQTKVKVVKPTSLMSFKLLKEAENLLLSKEAQ